MDVYIFCLGFACSEHCLGTHFDIVIALPVRLINVQNLGQSKQVVPSPRHLGDPQKHEGWDIAMLVREPFVQNDDCVWSECVNALAPGRHRIEF